MDEQMSDEERGQLLECEAICRRFLEWNLADAVERDEMGSVRTILAGVVEGPSE